MAWTDTAPEARLLTTDVGVPMGILVEGLVGLLDEDQARALRDSLSGCLCQLAARRMYDRWNAAA